MNSSNSTTTCSIEADHLAFDLRIQQIFRSALTPLEKGDQARSFANISELWGTYTHARGEQLRQVFRQPKARESYQRYYAPINASRLALLLRRMRAEGNLVLPKNRPLRVLDLGSGPLVGLLACTVAFGELGDSMAVDREYSVLKQGLSGLMALCESSKITMPQIKLLQANLLASVQNYRPRFAPDLIIVSHVMNEWGDPRRGLERRLQFVSNCIGFLAPQGRLLVVEPATRIQSRGLMVLRNALVQQGKISLLAPCTGAQFCPLLKQGQDWCHADFRWTAPAELEKVDQVLGFSRDLLKCSYLLLGKQSQTKQSMTNGEFVRIISGNMKDKQRTYRYGCTKHGRVVLDSFLQLARGERISQKDR